MRCCLLPSMSTYTLLLIQVGVAIIYLRQTSKSTIKIKKYTPVGYAKKTFTANRLGKKKR